MSDDLLRNPLWVAIGLTLVAAVALALVFLWQWQRKRMVRRARAARLAAISVDRVSDVMLPDGAGGTFHVDHLLLTPLGLLLLDIRDVRGHVFGGDQLQEWAVMDGARRYTFANPQTALYDRLAALRALAPEFQVDGRIVFADGATFPKGLPRFTLREAALATDFVMGDPTLAARTVEALWPAWERVKSALPPSPLARER
ncbi:MAG: NERD domain-containing protein [Steroidobacteraceae bacterium]